MNFSNCIGIILQCHIQQRFENSQVKLSLVCTRKHLHVPCWMLTCLQLWHAWTSSVCLVSAFRYYWHTLLIDDLSTVYLTFWLFCNTVRPRSFGNLLLLKEKKRKEKTVFSYTFFFSFFLFSGKKVKTYISNWHPVLSTVDRHAAFFCCSILYEIIQKKKMALFQPSKGNSPRSVVPCQHAFSQTSICFSCLAHFRLESNFNLVILNRLNDWL